MSSRLALSLVLALGCASYNLATTDYRSDPELRNVRLYSGFADTRGKELGTVAVHFAGRGSCQTATTQLMKDLLAESRVLGGNAVKNVWFRGRWNWMGRLACKGGKSERSSVEARAVGMAILAPELEAVGAEGPSDND